MLAICLGFWGSLCDQGRLCDLLGRTSIWELSFNYKDDLIPQACDFFRSSLELVKWQRSVKRTREEKPGGVSTF